MKQNFKIVFCIGVAFLFSFVVLGLFLEAYSQGILTSEKNIISVGGMFNQNPKQITLDVLKNVLGDSKTDNVNMNSLGFRGDEFEQIKPVNTFRIFLLGPSQVFGTGATSDNTTIPGYLQQLLNEKDFGFDIEVINSGMQGADSRKELLLLQNELLRFAPDLVVVYDGFNDLRSGASPTQLLDNWNSMCKLGQKHNFGVIVVLQPIIGFSQKSMTQEELVYLQNSKDYENNNLIDSLDQYKMYAENLEKLEYCVDKIDLRSVLDNELDSIYIDEESHISDKGNGIAAKSLYNEIFPIISENDEFNIFKNENGSDIVDASTYDGRDITVNVELTPSALPNDFNLKINTYDNTNKEDVVNVTYFLSISNNNEKLLNEYFFAQDGVLIINIQPNDEPQVKIIGELQYLHNAYVTFGSKYMPDLSGINLTSATPLQLIGPILNNDGIYTFDIQLRTIDKTSNVVYTLSDFHYEINFEKDN